MLLMSQIVLFNKPYGVLSQFTPEGRWKGLCDFIALPGIYPAGRLDADSEGLLLLTDHGPWQEKIADPRFKLEKTYWAQVEGEPDAAALAQLSAGVVLNDFTTRPARARRIEPPTSLWPRDPPIRYRASIPTTWIELRIREGKNRQVRRMCAAVGFPVLRLVRLAVGPFELGSIGCGEVAQLNEAALAKFGFVIGSSKKSSQTR
jgi:23S rRNA pseudouridine2457 synthase